MKLLRQLAFTALLFASVPALAADFRLASPDIAPGAAISTRQVLDGNGCRGDNLSPALAWSDAPAGTRSFAITVFDPDAPGGAGWWHWVLFNIPPDVDHLVAGASAAPGALPPTSTQLLNDFGTRGYGGPCPPPGDPAHRYVFTVYALSVASLPLDNAAPAAGAAAMLARFTLAKATIIARYHR